MTDEKTRLSRNDLNRAFEKQLAKREAAGSPTQEKASAHLAVVTTAAPGQFDSFFAAWDRYYPSIVSLLGWASWFLPGKTVNTIKALLAVVNNNIIPIIKEMLKQ